jgi:phage antirepressor YoqD-like protein
MKTLQINDGFEITTSELAQEMGIKHKSLFKLFDRIIPGFAKTLAMSGAVHEGYNIGVITSGDLSRLCDNCILNEDGSITPFTDEKSGISINKYKEMADKLIQAGEFAHDLIKKMDTMEQTIEEQTPLYEFGKTMKKSESLVDVRDVAKTLHITNIFKLLHAKGIFHYKHVRNNKTENKGRSYGVPKKEYIDRGYFELKQGTYETPKGEIRTYLKPMVTAKGELFIQRLFMKNTQKLIGG